MAEKKQVWSTADIIKNRTNWTLASDVELLKHIQSLSEKLVDKSRSTVQLLNSFEDDVNGACTSVANVCNRFEALSDTQFIENKVRDDSPETEKPPSLEVQQKETETNENIIEKLNEALSNGIQVLRTQYDIIAVTDSESEDDEPQEVLLKARNPFMSRRLPYVIGSEEFNMHDHLGLVTSSEDEDGENESEEDEEDDEKDDLPYLKKVVPQPERVNIGPNSRTQVIQVSSDSEDSDISSLGSREHEEKVAQNYAHSRSAQDTPKTPHNFAEHLNATLQNMSSNVVTPLVDDVFSPPPLPRNDDEQSSVDEGSDDSSDIFARRTKTAEPSVKSNTVSDIFDDEASRNVESSRISAKPSSTTDSSQTSGDSSTLKSAHTAANNEPRMPPKPRTNAPTSKPFSAVNAELINRFNKNVVAKDESTSSDDNDVVAFSKSSPPGSDRKKRVVVQKPKKPSELKSDSATSGEGSTTSSARIPNLHPEDVFENISPKSTSNKLEVAAKSRVDSVVGSGSSNSHQSPSITSKPNTSKIKPKVASLFDDDDSMDELFGSNSEDRKKASLPATTSAPRKVLFNDSDDLFSPAKEVEKLAGSAASLSTKKIALFDDDSDSGDDIFAIINSQKKKSTPSVTKADVERKPPLFSEDNLFVKTPSVGNETNLVVPSANESKVTVTSTSSTRTDIFETKITAEEASSRKNRTINKDANLFDTDNESDDIFSISAKSKKETPSSGGGEKPANDTFGSQIGGKSAAEIKQHESTSKSLFESVISKKESSFEFEKESADEDALPQTASKPSVVPRSTLLDHSNKKMTDSLFGAENDISNKKTVYDPEDKESANQDKCSKTTNQPIVIPRSNSEKINTDVPAPRIESDTSEGVLFDSKPDQPSGQTAFSKSANKPSVLPRSKFIEKTDLFSSSILEDQATSDSAEAVSTSRGAVGAPSRQFEETSTPPIPPRILDAVDSSAVDKIDGNQALTSRPPAPAKLAPIRGLNINVNALLPGSSWSSISKQVKGTVAETNNEERIAPASPVETQSTIVNEALKSAEQGPNSLTTMAKERAKIAGRRRPPSRRARMNRVLQSDVFASNPIADSTDEEPDSAYKTASESNSPEKNTSVAKSEAKIPGERTSSVPSLEETQFVPPLSAMTNYQKERSKLAKVVKKRPPSASKEKTKVNDSSADETENKNKTADDLGNILITASHSREPPAMLGNEFKSALSDSDKDDDPFDDTTTETENINDPIPEIDAHSNLLFSSSAFAPPFAVPKLSPVSKTTPLFESSEDDQSDDLFAKLKTPNSPPSSASSSTKNTKSLMSSNIVDQPAENLIAADKPVALEKDAHPSNTQLTNDFGTNVTSKSGTKSTSDLFSFNEDDSDDDDDLEALLSKVISPKVSSASTRSREVSSVAPAPPNVPAFDLNKGPDTPNTSKGTTASEPSKKSDLFAESDSLSKVETSVKSRATRSETSSLSTHSREEAKKSSSKTTTNLFDEDDDELFSSRRPSAKTKIAPSKSLFADDDDDDNSLFGNAAVSSHRVDKPIEISRSSISSTAPAEKARIVKLRSQTVEIDPLTGKIMKE